jgi:hypothetical protein
MISPDLQVHIGKQCDEADLLPLLIAQGLVRRVEEPGEEKVRSIAVADDTRAPKSNVKKMTDQPYKLGSPGNGTREVNPIVEESNPSPKSHARATKSPKSRRRSIHVIPKMTPIAAPRVAPTMPPSYS